MSKIKLIVMSLLLLLPCISFAQDTWDGTTATSFGGGSGTKSDPYLITSCEEWAYFCAQESWTGKYYKLACDMYFPQHEENTSNHTYAGSYTNPFDGIFDGNGHKVQMSEAGGLLFNYVKGTIKNLSFATIREYAPGSYGKSWWLGHIVMYLQSGGQIDNCYLYASGYVYAPSAPYMLYDLETGSIVSNTYMSGTVNTDAASGAHLFDGNNGCFSNCHSTFNGTPSDWTTNTTDYINCDKNVITEDEWKTNIQGASSFTIRFHDESGYTTTDPIVLSEASTITLPTPTCSCTFAGWYHNGKLITTSTLDVNTDMDLYAYWTRSVVSQPTALNPAFTIEDSENASFKWYKLAATDLFFPTWTSTNTGDETTSSYTYDINATTGQTLYIDWTVSSESADVFDITINGVSQLSQGGEKSGTFTYAIPSDGTYNVKVSYTKDGSDSEGSDQASVSRCYLGSTPTVTGYNSTLSSPELGSRYYCVATYNKEYSNISSPLSYTSDVIELNEGTCGDNLTWKVSDATLTISGTGAMDDYSILTNTTTGVKDYTSAAPWCTAFASSIEHVIVEEGVTSIGSEAFDGFEKVKDIQLPSSIESVGVAALWGCAELENITCEAVTPPTATRIGGTYNLDYDNIILYVPKSSIEAYKAVASWSYFDNIQAIPSSSTLLASGTSGTCTWEIDADGNMTIKPTSGNSGTLGCWSEINTPWFAYKTQIKSVKCEGSIIAQTCCAMFYNCINLISVDLTGLDTSNVTDMIQMFDHSGISSINLSNLDTHNVTDMRYMFNGCSSLTTLDISNFNTEKVTNMCGMFTGCTSLSSLDLSKFNTENVTTMAIMFNGCSSLTTLNISNFDTSNVTNMDFIFNDCNSLESLDLRNFITSKVTNMSAMFFDCNKLTSLNLSNFDTSNVTDMSQMFFRCNSLTNLDLSSFNTSKVTNMEEMFMNCYLLQQLNLSNFNTCNVTNITSMFYACHHLTNLNLTGFDASNVTSMSSTFEECSTLADVYSDSSTPSTLCDGFFSTLPTLSKATLHIMNDAKAAYEVAEGWKDFTNILANRLLVNGLLYNLDAETNTVSVRSVAGYDYDENIIIESNVTFDGIDYPVTKITKIGGDDIYKHIKNVYIPATVSTIDNVGDEVCDGRWGAFDTLHDGLETITVDSENPYFTSIDGSLYNKDVTHLIFGADKEIAEVPEGVTRISAYAFWGCQNLKTASLPQSLNCVLHRVFDTCSNLETINIPEGVTSLQYLCFHCCDKLNSISLPQSLTEIGEEVFAGCTSLSTIIIPSNVNNIGKDAFSTCTNLTKITCNVASPLVIESSVFNDVNQTGITLIIPHGTKALYEAADVWKDFGSIVEPYVYTAAISTHQGKTITLPVFMENTESTCGIQFDVVLPTGFSIATNSRTGKYEIALGSERFEDLDHTVSSQLQDDGSIRVLCSSATNAEIWNDDAEGNDIRATAPLLNITVNVADDVNPVNYDILLKNIITTGYVNGETTKSTCMDSYSTVSILNTYSVTANSTDANKGSVEVTGDNYANGEAVTGTDVTLTATPASGYAFVRWTENDSEVSTENPYIITVNADRNFTAEFTLVGDVYEDQTIDVADLTSTSGIILNPSNVERRKFVAADAYKDDAIDVADYTTIASIILNGGSSGNAKGMFNNSNNDIASVSMEGNLVAGGEGCLQFVLDNDDDAIANLQFDVMLPEGVTLADGNAIELTDRAEGHFVASAMQTNGALRIMVASPMNANINGANGSVVNIKVNAVKDLSEDAYNVIISNIVLSRSNNTCEKIAEVSNAISMNNATAISDIVSEQAASQTVYNLAGQKVNKAQNGIYIINGKKIIK